jgi:hypothetical protein
MAIIRLILMITWQEIDRSFYFGIANMY